jgi:hypothetical protein
MEIRRVVGATAIDVDGVVDHTAALRPVQLPARIHNHSGD